MLQVPTVSYTQVGPKLVGTPADAGGEQGYSVSLSSDGSVLAVGSPDANSQIGATFIFQRDGSGNYSQFGDKLVGTGYVGNLPLSGAGQGQSVALSSDSFTLAVGTYPWFSTDHKCRRETM